MNIIYKRKEYEENNNLRSLYVYENEHYFIRIFTDNQGYGDAIESLDVNVRCDMPKTVIEDYRSSLDESYDTVLITELEITLKKEYSMSLVLASFKGN